MIYNLKSCLGIVIILLDKKGQFHFPGSEEHKTVVVCNVQYKFEIDYSKSNCIILILIQGAIFVDLHIDKNISCIEDFIDVFVAKELFADIKKIGCPKKKNKNFESKKKKSFRNTKLSLIHQSVENS